MLRPDLELISVDDHVVEPLHTFIDRHAIAERHLIGLGKSCGTRPTTKPAKLPS